MKKLKEMREKGLKTRCTKLPVGAAHDINSVNLFFEVRAVRKITCTDTDTALQASQSLVFGGHLTNTETVYSITLTVPLNGGDRAAKFFKISGQLWLKRG